jgi:hypothetical protein
MSTEVIKERLLELQTSPELWASSRASYMLSMMEQQAQKHVLQSEVTAWMWDVNRRLREDAGDENPELATELEGLARQIGQITV